MTIFDFLVASPNVAFTAALVLMGALAFIEAIGFAFGTNAFQVLDADVDGNADGLAAWLGWLHYGRLPVLVVLTLFLASFGIAGLALQKIALSASGTLLPGWISIPVALVASLPLVRVSGSLLARVLPRDETYVARHEDLVGRAATVVLGEARHGSPAQAKLKDDVGQVQYVMVEPDDEATRFVAGQSVILVRHEGHRYRAIANPLAD